MPFVDYNKPEKWLCQDPGSISDNFFALLDDCLCITRQSYELIAAKKAYNDPCLYDGGSFDNNLISDNASEKQLDNDIVL